jgi:hypothetical protein
MVAVFFNLFCTPCPCNARAVECKARARRQQQQHDVQGRSVVRREMMTHSNAQTTCNSDIVYVHYILMCLQRQQLAVVTHLIPVGVGDALGQLKPAGNKTELQVMMCSRLRHYRIVIYGSGLQASHGHSSAYTRRSPCDGSICDTTVL